MREIAEVSERWVRRFTRTIERHRRYGVCTSATDLYMTIGTVPGGPRLRAIEEWLEVNGEELGLVSGDE